MHHKKSLVVLFSVLFALLFYGTALFSQSPVGTWVDSQHNITLVLAADGTYSLQFPNGSSQGRYSANGQNFCLQDNRPSQPVCYTVINYSANIMVLRDVNGITLNYKRQAGAGQPALPGASPQGNTGGNQYNQQNPQAGTQGRSHPNDLNPGMVLAQQAGQTLTGAHFNAGIGLTQFIIGQPLKSSEVNEIKAKLLQEFNQAPAYILQQLTSIGQSLQKIRTLTDPLQIGLMRQELFSALYQGTRHMQEAQKPLMIQVMNRYIKVLAFDPASKLVLTNKDTDGLINYLAFNGQLMGQNIQVTPALRNSVTTELVNQFVSMPLEKKRILCASSLIWHVLETNWNRLTPTQKQQYQQQFQSAWQAQMGNQGQSYASSYPAGNNQQYQGGQSTSNKSVTDQMADFQAKQNMFRMMNQMNLDSHVTSLNIIENMGGTGNYWSVVDY